MKKNYLSKTAMSANPLAMTVAKKSWQHTATTWLLLLFTVFGFSDAFGQVTINTANRSINSCTYPTSYVALGDIFIEENQDADFGFADSNTDYTLIITAPTNFEFQAGTGSVTFRNRDITAASINVTTTTITVTYRSSQIILRHNEDDRLTISGINFRGITGPSTGNMTRTGGTGVINGAAMGTVYGTLTSTNTPPPANGGGAATVCVGSNTPAFTNATGGGTWSIIPGTGNATITAGGVVTGTSAGTVTVRYTVNGCIANSALTVNPIPAAIAGGAATVCVGGTTPAFTNATAGGTWSTSNANATINASGVLTGVTSGTVRVIYTLPTGCFVQSALITINSLPTIVATPTPINGATGVCYAGSGAVNSISWGAVADATSYDVYFGAGSLPGTAIANVATNSYTLGTLNANTTYYWQVVPRNACGATSGTPATWTFTTSNAPCVCVPTSANNTYPISNVTFAGINNNSSATITAGPVYQDFTTISGNVTVGSTYNISVTSTGVTGNTFYQYVFFDWNNNGNFADDGGPYNIGNYTTETGTFNLNITIPLTATIGTIKFRVVNSFNSILNPCATTGYFQMEDYSLNIIAPTACTAPTAAPTALALSAGTPNGTAINGSFTAAVPAPNSYLVVVSTSNIAPSISNGTTYTIGGNAGVGYTVVDTDTNTTFTAGGLNPSTTYYFYVYSMNNVCSGGPLYNATPLTGNLSTGATVPTYCNATTLNGQATRYIDDISFLGMLNGNIYNLNTGSTTTPAPGGYQDWTGLATKPRQAQGGGVNISFESNSRGTWKAWVDWNKDGDFTDAGELVYTSAGVAMITNTFGFIIPTGATPGDYRVRIRTYNAFGNYDGDGTTCDNTSYEYYGDGANHFDSCTQLSTYTQNITTTCSTNSVNFTEYGETEDYLFTVVEMCEANIVTVTDGEICGPGTVNVSVTGTPGATGYRWYSTETGETLITSTTTGNWTTPDIGTTTSYWVTAFNGSCESLVRTEVIAKISPLPTITFTPSVPEVCGENNIVSITAGGDTELVYLIDENFEGSGLGVFSNDHITSTAYNTQTAWQKKTSTYIPNGSSWYPAISSNFGANHFAVVTSDIGTNGITIHNALVSPSVNTSTFLDLTLTFRMYYSRYYPDSNNPTVEYMNVEVSDNGGAWTSISGGNIITDQGYGTDFKEFSYDMSAYINRPNISVRIRYYADNWYDGAAVDDIQLFGTRPLNTSFEWTSLLPVDAYLDPTATTTPYTTGTPAVTVYIRPTMAQLEQTTYSFTATAVLNNGCSASSVVTINNRSKIWKGGTNGDWSVANNWLPVGVPDATNCVIIPPATNNALVSGTNVNGYGKTLQVINGGNLKINPTNTLTITDFVEVRGATSVFDVKNSASLIQVNNVVNSGIMNMERTANIRKLDYVYWSSPVTFASSFSSGAISPLSPTNLIFKWTPTIASNVYGFGNWTQAVENMAVGKGYIVRGPNTFTATAAPYTATFIGTPNNGNITAPIQRGTYDGDNYDTMVSTSQGTKVDDNWNLLGNPYPSAINAISFLTANTNIDGQVKIWTHGNLPDAATIDPFYNDYVYNYTVNDYITYNSSGASSGPDTYNGYIPAGQGFFVSMLHGTAATNETVQFNNTMRSSTYNNSVFYRTAEENSATNEEGRIWLDIVNANGQNVRTLVAYVEGATNERDRLFDAFTDNKTDLNLYSNVENEHMIIQGRRLPFEQNDQVPMGIKVAQDGTYTITIAAVEGLFSNASQTIYIEDTQTNIIHNLRQSPYSFAATTGNHANRFVLRYTNETLGTNDLILDEASVWVFSDHSLTVKSSKNEIQSVRVFDLLGRALAHYPNANSMEVPLTTIQQTDSGLIIQVTLSNGAVVTKKTIY